MGMTFSLLLKQKTDQTELVAWVSVFKSQLIRGSLTKPSSLNPPTAFTCKSLYGWQSWSPPRPPQPQTSSSWALQLYQQQHLSQWGMILINQGHWMETNQIESPFGFSSLAAWVKSDAGREAALASTHSTGDTVRGRREEAGREAALDGQRQAHAGRHGE